MSLIQWIRRLTLSFVVFVGVSTILYNIYWNTALNAAELTPLLDLSVTPWKPIVLLSAGAVIIWLFRRRSPDLQDDPSPEPRPALDYEDSAYCRGEPRDLDTPSVLSILSEPDDADHDRSNNN